MILKTCLHQAPALRVVMRTLREGTGQAGWTSCCLSSLTLLALATFGAFHICATEMEGVSEKSILDLLHNYLLLGLFLQLLVLRNKHNNCYYSKTVSNDSLFKL